jgi:hypothetical protein
LNKCFIPNLDALQTKHLFSPRRRRSPGYEELFTWAQPAAEDGRAEELVAAA